MIASLFLGFDDRYASVTFCAPSLIIRCTMISDLNATVHVESRNRCVKVLNTSATPASPDWVANSRCSTYFVFGAASLTFVPPFTLFSKLEDMMAYLRAACGVGWGNGDSGIKCAATRFEEASYGVTTGEGMAAKLVQKTWDQARTRQAGREAVADGGAYQAITLKLRARR